MKTIVATLGAAIILGLTTMFIGGQPVKAGPCSAVVSKPVSNGHVVSTTVVPTTYNYGHSYGNSYGGHNAYNGYFPVVQQLQTIPDFFYSSRDFDRDAALLEAVKALREQLNTRSTSVQLPAKAAAVIDELPSLSVGASGNRTAPSGDVLKDAVNAHCIRCHNGTKGHLDLTDLTKLSAKQKAQFVIQVETDKMPPGRGLGVDEKKVFGTILD